MGGAGKGTTDLKAAEEGNRSAMFPRRVFKWLAQKKECPRIAAGEEREIVV